MRIGFLLGAGVSLPAGMPSTAALTEAVLRPENYWRHSDETFHKVPPPSLDFWPNDHRSRKNVIQLLQHVQAQCNSYYATHWPGRSINYEDVYYCVSQFAEHLSSEYENPLIDNSVPGIGQLSRRQLTELTYFVQEYIESAIRIELWQRPTRRDNLSLLTDALADPQLEPCSIFTLNHDCLIEEAIRSLGLPLADGFERQDGDLLIWDPQTLAHTAKHLLLKLHGSVDWLYYSHAPRFSWTLI